MKNEKIVSFKSGKFDVHGILHLPSLEKKAPCVILFHGLTGDSMEAHFRYVKLARKMVKKGIAVLRFDFRGSGDSDMEFSKMTLETEINDAIASVKFIRSRKEIDPLRIGISGHSMGGFVAACLLNTFPEIRSAALSCAVARFKGLWAAEFPKNGLDRNGNLLGKGLYESVQKLDGYNLIGINNYRNNLMVINSNNDETVPYEDSNIYYKISAAKNKKRVTVKGGFHCYDSVKHEAFANNKIIEWFKGTL